MVVATGPLTAESWEQDSVKALAVAWAAVKALESGVGTDVRSVLVTAEALVVEKAAVSETATVGGSATESERTLARALEVRKAEATGWGLGPGLAARWAVDSVPALEAGTAPA